MAFSRWTLWIWECIACNFFFYVFVERNSKEINDCRRPIIIQIFSDFPYKFYIGCKRQPFKLNNYILTSLWNKSTCIYMCSQKNTANRAQIIAQKNRFLVFVSYSNRSRLRLLSFFYYKYRCMQINIKSCVL